MKLHTDRAILRCIFDMYASEYPAKGDPWLPIDVAAVARKLGCSHELLGGRLLHDLSHRFRYREEFGTKRVHTPLFEKNVGSLRDCVNFPYVAAMLAGMDAEYKRNSLTWLLSVVAIVISLASAAAAWTAVAFKGSGASLKTKAQAVEHVRYPLERVKLR